MKNLLIFLLISTTSFAQNKKEQIEILNFRVDSLNQLINTKTSQLHQMEVETESLNQVNKLKQDEISNLKTNISKLELTVSKLTSDNKSLKTELSQQKLLTIEVTNKFNGYNIKIFWFPFFLYGNIGIKGPAVIEFKNENGDVYYAQNLNFSLPNNNLPIVVDTNNGNIKYLTQSIIKKTYSEKVFTSFDEVYDADDWEHHFMFLLDINFDGKLELFTIGDQDAQRSGDTFIPIFDELGIGIKSYISDVDILYSKLDFLTVLDNKNKTIKVRASNGADSSYGEIYKYDSGCECFLFVKRTSY